MIETQNSIASSHLVPEQVMQLVAGRARELTGAGSALVAVADGEELVLIGAAGSAAAERGARVSLDAAAGGRCVRENRTLRAALTVCVPLRDADGSARGVLEVQAPRSGEFSDLDVDTLELLSELMSAHMHPNGGPMDDPLSGLGGRRAYDAMLSRELDRARRYDQPLSLALFDIEQLKRVNIEYGRERGDQVIAAMGRIMATVRGSDGAFRLRDDEFALVLPSTPADGARVLVARLCREISRAEEVGRLVNVSVGVADAPLDDPLALEQVARDRLRERKLSRSA